MDDPQGQSAAQSGALALRQEVRGEPATGKDLNTGDITQLEPNIHAGVKYIRRLQDRYFQGLPHDLQAERLRALETTKRSE